MNIIISNSSSVPIYEQIKQSIKQAILNNELREEDMLPSVRVMANDLKISFLTVQEKKRKEIQNYIEKIIKLAQMSDISEKEIIELFKLMYKGEI